MAAKRSDNFESWWSMSMWLLSFASAKFRLGHSEQESNLKMGRDFERRNENRTFPVSFFLNISGDTRNGDAKEDDRIARVCARNWIRNVAQLDITTPTTATITTRGSKRSSTNRELKLKAFTLVSSLLFVFAFQMVACLGANNQSASTRDSVHVKVGILLEESDHEQANMFIRTIKMINERRDETIRQLLNEPSEEFAESRRATPTSTATATTTPTTTTASARLQLANAVQVKLEPVIEFLSDRHSSLEADSKVCQLIESGVRAIVGPSEGNSIQHVQSICDNLEIPYFELRPFLGSPSSSWPPLSGSSTAPTLSTLQGAQARPEPRPESGQTTAAAAAAQQRPGGAGANTHHYWAAENRQQHQQRRALKLEDLSLNLFPPAHLLNSAYMDLIYALNWTSFAIVYEDASSMIKLQDLFRESSGGSWTNKWQIKLFPHYTGGQMEQQSGNGNNTQDRKNNARQVTNGRATATGSGGQPANSGPRTFRDVFWRVKTSGERNVLLDVKTENLYEALKHAQQVGLMTEEYSYLVTSLDLHMIDMEDFKYSRTKITAFSVLHIPKSAPLLAGGRAGQLAELAAGTRALHAQAAPGDGGGADQVGAIFDEKYLERLGVHVIQAAAHDAGQQREQSQPARQRTSAAAAAPRQAKQVHARNFVAPDSTFGLASSDFALSDSDLARREMLQSSPASMGLLPSVDRNNEQRLFEFFVEQQERHQSHVRLSTSSAVLHDSLVLYLLALQELDPSGSLLLGQNNQPNSPSVSCANSNSAAPWPHGSSLTNYMRRISFTGLTGAINFDQNGLRTDLKLNVMGLAPNIRPVKVGEWHSRRSSRSPGAHRAAPPVAQVDSATPSGSQPAVGATTTPKAGAESGQTRPGAQVPPPLPATAAAAASMSYDELSNRYEAELKRYTQMLANGLQVVVPYSKPTSASRSLMVNEIIFDRLFKEQADQIDTLVVTAKLSQPYFMLKETPNRLEGNDQFEGFAVDLIHELSKLVNFKYQWRVVADNKYGSKEIYPNGTVAWNGMIGEIVRGQADLAIVDLTITAQREEAVDFTLPFMNTGISILFKKPTTKVTTLFSFLSPFSSDVWAYVLAAYCGISAILFLVGHLSPYEWANPHPCRHLTNDDETTVLKNQFSLLNSFWFTIGSLMQQGSDLTPRSMSTRTIAGIWYFFTLIMISSYTANLAAFLTVEKVVYPIENVRDLSQQQEIKYGCVESGSTCTFFHDSQIDTYKRIDETMSKYRTYVRSNDEGQKRVGEGKFAFFMESTTIEYIIERNCNLTQIGGLIDSKGYGLATSKKSRLKRPYRTLLNEGILHLQETGMLHVLKNRWWKERRGGGTCTDDGKGGGVTELSLANVGGVFVVLLGGLGISFLVAIAEFMWRARRGGSSRDRMCEEMMNDLKFALACKSSTKPIARDGATRGRSARRLIHQQESSTSQYSNSEMVANLTTQANMMAAADCQRPAHLATKKVAANGKDCDPILVHAMITMLMQQQAEQQQRQQQQQAMANGYVANHQYLQSASSSELEPMDSNNNNNNERQAPTNHGNRRQQQFHWGESRSESANRKRLLYAQHNTIDSTFADETSSAQAPGQRRQNEAKRQQHRN